MCVSQQWQKADGTREGSLVPLFGALANDDALRKARGEPTQNFHDVQPNYNNPRVRQAQGQRATTTGTPAPTRVAKRGVDK